MRGANTKEQRGNPPPEECVTELNWTPGSSWRCWGGNLWKSYQSNNSALLKCGRWLPPTLILLHLSEANTDTTILATQQPGAERFLCSLLYSWQTIKIKKQQQLHGGSRVDWYAALYFPSALRSNHTLPAQLPGRWRTWVFHPRTWTNKTVDQRNEPHTVGRETHLSNPLTYSHLQDQSHFTEQYKWLLTRCCDSTGSWDHEGITADDFYKNMDLSVKLVWMEQKLWFSCGPVVGLLQFFYIPRTVKASLALIWWIIL